MPGTGIKLKIQDSLAPFFKDISQPSHSSAHPSVLPFDHLFIYLLFKYLLALPIVQAQMLDVGTMDLQLNFASIKIIVGKRLKKK